VAGLERQTGRIKQQQTTKDYTGKGNPEPMVSVLLPTYNRPGYLSEALGSVLRQSHKHLEVIVINDGGEDVSDVISSFDENRIHFINRKENRGKAYSLNEALEQAKGKYIAYLDDDDIYYPHHIKTLVNTLESPTECQVAYSDLYKTYCRINPDTSRVVLSKVVEVSRDFDRFLILYYNQALHVSLLHRRDLIEKTGGYNEQLRVLIDWDMSRRLAFFSDFYHVREITGEFFCPIGENDRISYKRRQDIQEYMKDILRIRTTRPAKPWPKIKDMSIILLTEKINKQAGETLAPLWRWTFYPYKLYLPLPQSELDRLQTKMPNIVRVPVEASASKTRRIDAALEKCEGEYVTIVPSGFDIQDTWVEDPLYALVNSDTVKDAYELDGSTDNCWAVVLRKKELLQARRNYPQLTLRESLNKEGIETKRVKPEQIPLQFDQLLNEGRDTVNEGDYLMAGEIFEYIGKNYQNELWMSSLAADAYFKAGRYTKAGQLISTVNQQRPTVDTLVLEAKLKRKQNNIESAITLLEKAEEILEGKGLVWT